MNDVSETNETAAAAEEMPKNMIFGDFTGETMSLKDAMDLTKKSKVTVLKVIRDNKIKSVGKIVTAKRGRPGNLYNKEQLMTALLRS